MSRVLKAGGFRRGAPKPWLTEEYRRYLLSPKWKAKRDAVLYRDKHICRRCGGAATEVHHRNYERLGQENYADLESLCQTCHEGIHQKQQREIESRNAAALYNARLDGWASKKYGEDWHMFADDAEEEFDRWIEDRNDYD